MTPHLASPHTTTALLDADADTVRGATCPMCHTPGNISQSAIEAGGDWRCVRCGQRWDAGRLAAVSAYNAWAVEHDRVAGRTADSSSERLGGRP